MLELINKVVYLNHNTTDMNQLPLEKRTQIVNLLVEGSSLRAISRITGCSINTVTKLLVNVGTACQMYHDETVRGLATTKVQCDEIWSFVYSKEKNTTEGMKAGGAGDVWTWTGIDADSKLIIDWFVGDRDAESANYFMEGIATRLSNRVQMTTDGLKIYLEAVYNNFEGLIDFAQLIKIYGGNEGVGNEKRYSPADCTGTKKVTVSGNPDKRHISTSYIERQNLTMRMHMRRFTRLTNGFSKKLENHCHAIALHFVYYNFGKIHKTLRVTPAMEAGLAKNVMSIEEIVLLTEKYSN